jgi:hypothetical protein
MPKPNPREAAKTVRGSPVAYVVLTEKMHSTFNKAGLPAILYSAK